PDAGNPNDRTAGAPPLRSNEGTGRRREGDSQRDQSDEIGTADAVETVFGSARAVSLATGSSTSNTIGSEIQTGTVSPRAHAGVNLILRSDVSRTTLSSTGKPLVSLIVVLRATPYASLNIQSSIRTG